jgi:D-amino-acid dehydrogenase
MNPGPTVIIGGGITGLCTAYYLIKRGAPVILISQDPIGDGASGGNAGILAAGHLPLPRPGLAAKALRWMLDRESPLYIPPRLDLGLLHWLWDFNRACSHRQVTHCMDILTPLGRLTMECWRDLLVEVDIKCDFRPRGWLNVFRSEIGRREAAHEAVLVQDLGFEVARYSGQELREKEPAFGPAVTGAVHYRDSASLDPLAFMRGLVGRLAELGVAIRSGEEVTELIVEKERCLGVRLASGAEVRGSHTVLAAGIWSTKLAQAAGLKLPMQGGKGYHLDLESPTPELGTAAVLLENSIAVTPMNGRLRLAGTVEFSGVNRNLVASRVKMLSTGAADYLSGVPAANVLARGCDLRPCTADGLPVLGWAPQIQNLFVSTGGAKMGMTLGPALGQAAAEILLDGKPSLDLSTLRADRF